MTFDFLPFFNLHTKQNNNPCLNCLLYNFPLIKQPKKKEKKEKSLVFTIPNMQITKNTSPKTTTKTIAKSSSSNLLNNIKKEELVRLMMQSLIDLGYQ